MERAPEFLPDAGDLNLTANLGSRRRITQGASQKREARSDYPIAQRPTPPRRSISEGCSWKRALVFWRESAEGAEAVRIRDRGDRTAVPPGSGQLVAREVEPQRPQMGHRRRIAEAAKRRLQRARADAGGRTDLVGLDKNGAIAGRLEPSFFVENARGCLHSYSAFVIVSPRLAVKWEGETS